MAGATFQSGGWARNGLPRAHAKDTAHRTGPSANEPPRVMMEEQTKKQARLQTCKLAQCMRVQGGARPQQGFHRALLTTR